MKTIDAIVAAVKFKGQTIKIDNSSFLRKVSYNESSKEMFIMIKHGTKFSTYKYEGVPKDIVMELTNAESPGKYFNQEIRGVYDAWKLETSASTLGGVVAAVLATYGDDPLAVKARENLEAVCKQAKASRSDQRWFAKLATSSLPVLAMLPLTDMANMTQEMANAIPR